MPTVTEIITLPNRRSRGTARRKRQRGRNPQKQVQVQQTISRVSKRKRRARKSPGQRRSQASDYLCTLLDPENCPGVKIPDLVCAPSGTFQLTYDNVLPVQSGGDGVAFSVNNNLLSGSPLFVGANTAVGGNYVFTGQDYAGSAGVNALYEEVRLVSSVLYAEYAGTTLADSGQIVGYLQLAGQATPASFALGQKEAYSKTRAVRCGLKVLYKPFDNDDLAFQTTAGNQVYNALNIMTAGMQVGASIRIRVVSNFEGIPKASNSSFVNAAPSPVSLQDLSSTTSYLSAQGMYEYVQPLINYFGPFAAGAAMPALTAGYQQNRQRTGYGNRIPGNARFEPLGEMV